MKQEYDYRPLLAVAEKLEKAMYCLTIPGSIMFGAGIVAHVPTCWKIGLCLVTIAMLLALTSDLIMEYALRKAGFKR